MRQRTLAVAAGQALRGRWRSGGLLGAWFARLGFWSWGPAEDDFEAEGAELADVVGGLPADAGLAVVVVRAEVLIAHAGAGQQLVVARVRRRLRDRRGVSDPSPLLDRAAIEEAFRRLGDRLARRRRGGRPLHVRRCCNRAPQRVPHRRWPLRTTRAGPLVTSMPSSSRTASFLRKHWRWLPSSTCPVGG